MIDDVDLDLGKHTPASPDRLITLRPQQAALLSPRRSNAKAHRRPGPWTEAIDTVIASPQKRTRVMRDHEEARYRLRVESPCARSRGRLLDRSR